MRVLSCIKISRAICKNSYTFSQLRKMSIESDVVRDHDIRLSYEQSFPEFSPSDEGKQKIFQIFAKQDFVKTVTQRELEGLFENFYWLIYQYVKRQFLQQTRNTSSSNRKPLFIGLSAPQVCLVTSKILSTVLMDSLDREVVKRH